MHDNVIRIEMQIDGDVYQKEINPYDASAHPLKSEVDCLLNEGWEKLYFY